jgi:acyl carrier protein
MISKDVVDKYLRKKLILEYIVSNFGSEDDILPNMNLKYDFGMDSLDLYELCMNVEREYNVSIPDPEFARRVEVDMSYEELVEAFTDLINQFEK